MAVRTTQLQIRVTPEEKATLKRLARRAGQSVSSYVLSHALPSSTFALAGALGGLRTGGGPELRRAISTLGRVIAELGPVDFAAGLADASVAGLPPLAQNYFAALVEKAANERGVDPPPWTQGVPPLERPYFRWPLRSLWPYQLRVAPVALKRRNIFDPSLKSEPLRGDPTSPEALRRIEKLDTHLGVLELDVEFYYLGGALLHQAFASRASTARPSAIFRPARLAAEAATNVARGGGWPAGWLLEAVHALLGAGGQSRRFVELPNLKVYTPRAEYVLAIKTAAIESADAPRELEDLRFLLRSLNVSTAEGALSIATRYFSERQLPPRAGEVVQTLLGA